MSVSELSGRSKAAIVVIVVLLAAAGAVGYVLRARSAASSPAGAPGGAAPAGAPATPLPRETSLEPGSLLMVRAGPSADSGTVLAVPGRGESAARATGLHCKRFYAAKGTALCLRVTTGLVTRSEAVVLDGHLREKRAVPLSGVPSRARVSASGRMAAWTFFVTGDSYLATGFSTRAGILDTRTGKLVKSLEDFTLEMDGRAHRAPDVNYWGVTFAADDNRFYATVSTGGRTYLIEGDFAARRMRTLRENAECPSLSPDGERLVYKKRTGDAADPWRLYTLDLRTGQEKALAETANVDDQAAWLDDRTVMYSRLRGDSSDVWTVPADGSGRPALLLRDAYSPAAT